jgi:hypothetical protein
MKTIALLYCLAFSMSISNCNEGNESESTGTGQNPGQTQARKGSQQNCLKTYDGQDSIDLTNHEVTFTEAEGRATKFKDCFKADGRNLTPSNIEINYDALMALKASAENGAGNYFKALIIHYGLTSDMKAIQYIFQTALCQTADNGTTRNYTITPQSYYTYNSAQARFDPTDDLTAIQRYKQNVLIKRAGSGATYEPYNDHAGMTAADNASSILFPFQEIHALHNDNASVFDMRTINLFSVCRGDMQNNQPNIFKHYIIISPIRGQQLVPRFYLKSANLGSLCPVNCNAVRLSVECN